MLHPPNCDQLHHLAWVLILGHNNKSLEVQSLLLSLQRSHLVLRVRSEVKKDISHHPFSPVSLTAGSAAVTGSSAKLFYRHSNSAKKTQTLYPSLGNLLQKAANHLCDVQSVEGSR